MSAAKLDYATLCEAIDGDPNNVLTVQAQERVLHTIVAAVSYVLGCDHPCIIDVASLALTAVWDRFDQFRLSVARGQPCAADAATWVARIARQTARQYVST